MLYLVLWIFVYCVFFSIIASSIIINITRYLMYKSFRPYGIKCSWNIIPYLNKRIFLFMGREHFAENDYKLRKKYPTERFVARIEQFEPIIVLQDLALIRKLTVKSFNNFVDRKLYIEDYLELLTERCLYFLGDRDWQDMRSTISPAFTTFRIKQMIPFIEFVTKDLVDVILHNIENSSDNFLEIDVREVASFMVNDVIANCLYDVNVSTIREGNNEFYEMGNIIANDRKNYVPHHFYRYYFDTPNNHVAQTYFYLLALTSMDRRELYPVDRSDMLQLFVQARKGMLKHDDRSSEDRKEFGFASVPESKPGKKREQKVRRPDLDFAAQAASFHGEGYNTVVTALSFALHELALQPDIQDRLAREIMLHHERNNGVVTLKSIKNMKYMDMVVSETLRLWPPITCLERVCVKDWLIGKPNPRASRDYMIKKDTRVWIPIWAIHRDPDLFPNPDKFDPERFSERNIAKINPMAYMPFGSGPRNCIGSKFALCELKIFLYYIILNTEVYPSKKTCIPSRLCPKSLDVRLKGGHTLNIKARSLYRDMSS